MALLKSFARRLAQTRFGRESLTTPGERFVWQPPIGARVYGGLVLLVVSFLALPAVIVLSYLSVKFTKPAVIVVGGPIVIVLGHVMFGVGVYLAGKDYVLGMLHWAAKRFLERYA